MEKPFGLRLSVRLFAEGEKCFGPGLAELLERIDGAGSLRAAAAEMEMAYSNAWTTLRRCEKALGFSLLERQAGGSRGGRSRLTGEGRRLLEDYRVLEAKLDRTGQGLLEALNGRWTNGGND